MKTIYQCECCGKTFNTMDQCKECEMSHLGGIEKTKYAIQSEPHKELCNFCEHSFYVYGCEQDCSEKNCSWTNNYKDFIPVEPLHDKSESGGI